MNDRNRLKVDPERPNAQYALWLALLFALSVAIFFGSQSAMSLGAGAAVLLLGIAFVAFVYVCDHREPAMPQAYTAGPNSASEPYDDGESGCNAR